MTYIEWLEKQGFQKAPPIGKSTEEHWFRASKYGVTKCRSAPDKAFEINVTRDTKLAKNGNNAVFTMSCMGDNGHYWMQCSAFELTEELLIKKGRDIEMRLVDAWRGFN